MLSVKSCFNPTLFCKNLMRFWPIWALYGAMWLLALPLSIFNVEYWGGKWNMDNAQRIPLSLLESGGLMSAAVFGVLCAMAVFSYLYNNRSVGMLHALPIRRRDLFCTNFLAGLSFLILPNLAVFLLSLLAEALNGAVDFGSLCMWLVVQSLLCFFFYAFAVFCAMFTGHLLALPAFYGILNILASALMFLIQNLAQEFIFGFDSLSRLENTALLFTPVMKLATTMQVRQLDGRGAAFYGLHMVLLYAFVGVVLTALALLVYEKRHLETAGDVVTVPWVKPIFKYGVAFCAAIAFGTFLYRVLNVPDGPWTLLVLLLLCGGVGYFAAEMLLKKSFRVIRESWKGCIAVLVCLTAAVCVMEFNLVGFERKVPDPARVASARVSYSTEPYDNISDANVTLSGERELTLLAQVHQAAVDSKDTPWDFLYTDMDGVNIQTHSAVHLNIEYTMEDGSVIRRRYEHLPVRAEDKDNPNSLTALLTALVNQPDVVERSYFSSGIWKIAEDIRLVDAEVTSMYNEEDPEKMYDSVVVPAGALPRLEEAIHADIAAGRLGVRYLMSDWERMNNCYLSDLCLSFRVNLRFESSEQNHISSTDVRIALEASATETLKVLEDCGVITDTVYPVTHMEDHQRQAEEPYPGPNTEAVEHTYPETEGSSEIDW